MHNRQRRAKPQIAGISSRRHGGSFSQLGVFRLSKLIWRGKLFLLVLLEIQGVFDFVAKIRVSIKALAAAAVVAIAAAPM